MFIKCLKIFITASIISTIACFSSFAAGKASFPFSVEFDTDEIDRVCYAGHKGSTVRYKDGYAILPYTFFSIKPVTVGENGANIENLSAEISLIYENDTQSGSHKETIRTYDEGDLNSEDSFQILSDNIIANLEERDMLYSGSLEGMVLTLNLNGREDQKEDIYLYVCSEDDYYTYLDNSYDE